MTVDGGNGGRHGRWVWVFGLALVLAALGGWWFRAADDAPSVPRPGPVASP